MAKTIDQLIEQFTSPELHNLAMIAKSWNDDKTEFYELHTATTPREVLFAADEILSDAMFSTKGSIMEKLKRITDKEAKLLTDELIKNYNEYFEEPDLI